MTFADPPVNPSCSMRSTIERSSVPTVSAIAFRPAMRSAAGSIFMRSASRRWSVALRKCFFSSISGALMRDS